jgi:acyl-CoA thioesterase FadM
MGHVNNIMYNRFAESSRVGYFRNFTAAVDEQYKQAWIDLMTPKAVGLILKSIKTDYKFPLVYPDTVTVLHKLLTRPTAESTNIDMEVVIISEKEQRPAARCFEDIVTYDYRIAKKAPLPSFVVDELDKAYDAQEEVKAETLKKIKELQQTLE